MENRDRGEEDKERAGEQENRKTRCFYCISSNSIICMLHMQSRDISTFTNCHDSLTNHTAT